MFSTLASRFRAETNPLYRIREEILSQGLTVQDLVSTNPGEHGIRFPQEVLEEALLDGIRRSIVFSPDSLGQRPAREAIESFYRAAGVTMPAESILLTPGTSLAYFYSFKLLANEGEEVLCPRPSYPLFDYIAALSGVRLVSYPMRESRGWRIDMDLLDASVSTSTRAVILISPHNPTGHIATAEEVEQLAALARRHNLAIISDEVFSEFLLESPSLPRPACSDAPLVLTLNGFSKMFALPGIKFGWLGITGDPSLVAEAVRTLEYISDTFLPVNEVVQAAAPRLFEGGGDFLRGYRDSIRERWRAARSILAAGSGCDFVPPDGGFYVTLSLSARDEEEVAASLLRRHRLLVHPGYFYDIRPNHLVLSFVRDPGFMASSLEHLMSLIEGTEDGS